MRLTIIQYGDFRADFRRLAAGGAETYQGQRRSVDMLAGLAGDGRMVMIVNVHTDSVFEEALSPDLDVIGLGPRGPGTGWRGWWKLLNRLDPQRVLLRTPILPVLAWCTARRRPVLAVLADSFQGSGARKRLKRLAMRAALSAPSTDYVGNHGRASSFQLAAMGVPKRKVIPWDLVPDNTPAARQPKPGLAVGASINLLFAGHLTTPKGAEDAIRATALLVDRGLDARLAMLGPGEFDRMAALAESLGIAARVEIAGRVPNGEVATRMRAADFVLVPSRHEYPEGLPLTIYEAFCARTPLIASDHPMFVGNIEDGIAAAIFPAGDATAMADRIAALAADPARYAKLSHNALAAWQRLQLPVTFETLVERWLAGDRAWLDDHTLAARDYSVKPTVA